MSKKKLATTASQTHCESIRIVNGTVSGRTWTMTALEKIKQGAGENCRGCRRGERKKITNKSIYERMQEDRTPYAGYI